jgi:hypothetical protein
MRRAAAVARKQARITPRREAAQSGLGPRQDLAYIVVRQKPGLMSTGQAHRSNRTVSIRSRRELAQSDDHRPIHQPMRRILQRREKNIVTLPDRHRSRHAVLSHPP